MDLLKTIELLGRIANDRKKGPEPRRCEVEQLEDKNMPAVTAHFYSIPGQLDVTGDEGANEIRVRDNFGSVRVEQKSAGVWVNVPITGAIPWDFQVQTMNIDLNEENDSLDLSAVTGTATTGWKNLGVTSVFADTGNDSIEGTRGVGADWIEGNNGNDTIHGAIGGDTILGGIGTDKIYGDEGADSLMGGDEPDCIWGGDQDDTIFGDDGTDSLGDDTIWGDAGDDSILGGGGRDCIQGGANNDTIYGNTGDDVLSGDGLLPDSASDGNDCIFGNQGTDILRGMNGNDSMDGGDQNDSLYGYDGDDWMDGGDGENGGLLDYGVGGGGSDTNVGDPERIEIFHADEPPQ